MPKNSSQKGSVKISTFAGIAIIAAVVVVASTIAVIKYREVASISAPVVVITPKSTLSATLTPIVDKIADWQTYKNDQLGFEFKYPSFFHEASDGYLPNSKIILTLSTDIDYNRDNGEGDITIGVSQEKLNLENIISPYENKIEKKDLKNIIIDGKQSYFYFDDSGQACGGSIALIPDNNQTFQISFMDCQVPPGATYNLAESYMNQILSTFKFIK